MKKDLSTSLTYLSAAFLLLVLQFVFVHAYLEQEQTIHFWDYAMYANRARVWLAIDKPELLWESFWASFSYKYNLLYALPAYWTFRFFEATRTVFIETNYAVYFVAQLLALALVIGRTFQQSLAKSFVYSIVLSGLIPFAWYPLLQGYPDNGAGALLLFAFAVALGNRTKWYNPLLLGALLGLSIVFRRHFAYPALALLASIAFLDLQTLVKAGAKKKAYFPLLRYGGTAAATAVAVLAAIEPSYFKEMLTTDFQSLYRSYEREAGYFSLFLLGRIGLLLGALVSAGFLLAFKNRPESKKPLILLCVFGGLWFVLWILGPSQTGDHYLIAVPPVLCFVGLAGFFLVVTDKLTMKMGALLGAVLLGLGANSAHALWFAEEFPAPNAAPTPGVFSVARPPWILKDRDRLLDLANHLTHTTTPSDRIAVVASSFILNQDLMRALYTDVLRRPSTARRFVLTPEVDEVQYAPLDAYAGANVYVVPDPPQYHLPASGQKVITSFASQFPPPSSLATYFAKDPEVFVLSSGVKIHIWRRLPWTPGALHAGLTAIRKIKEAPIRWVGEKRPVDFITTITEVSGETVQLRFNAEARSGEIFYDKPLPLGAYRFGGVMNAQYICQKPELKIRVRDYAGTVVFEQSTPLENSAKPFAALALAHQGNGGPYYISAEITVQPLGECTMAIGHLQVEEIAVEGLPTQPRPE